MTKIASALLVYSVLLFGCATNEPQLLSTAIVHSGSPSINPSLSQPEEGNHYHVSGSYSPDAEFSTDLSTHEKGTTFLVSGGWYHQPTLYSDFLISPYWGVDGAVSYSSVRFYPIDNAASILSTQGVDYKKTFADFGIDLYVRPGITSKFYIGTFSVFGLGIVKCETGDYFSFRKDNDGIATIYNMTANPVSVGYGWGADVQLGYAKYWDLGLLVQIEYLYNRTQSYQSDKDVESVSNGVTTYKNVVSTTPGGVLRQLGNGKLECYLDILNYRLSASGYPFGPFSVNGTYRF